MEDYFQIAKNVLELEASSIQMASRRLTKELVLETVELFKRLSQSGGSLIFCGVGKSGIVAEKLAATFSSLGKKSYFVHPTEALHGGLGNICAGDAICFISKSGTAEEILKLLPFISIEKEMRFAILGDINSPIAKNCEFSFDCHVESEACLQNQAPTTSTTTALAVGDALAVVYEKFIGISKEDFASNHPGGILGKRLKMRVLDLMWRADQTPMFKEDATLQEVLLGMTQKNVGGAAIVDESENLLGIIVEGDIRRYFAKGGANLLVKAKEVMTKSPISIGESELAYLALELMERRASQIYVLPVIRDKNRFVGFIRLHDLLKEGF